MSERTEQNKEQWDREYWARFRKAWLNLPADKGLKLALTLADDRLEWIEDYFDNKADADGDSEGTYPSLEMNRLRDVREVRDTLKRIIEDLP